MYTELGSLRFFIDSIYFKIIETVVKNIQVLDKLRTSGLKITDKDLIISLCKVGLQEIYEC